MADLSYRKVKRDHSDYATRFDEAKCPNECDRDITEWANYFEKLYCKLSETPEFQIGFSQSTTNLQRVRFCLNYKTIRESMEHYIQTFTRAEKVNCGCGLGHLKVAARAAEYRATGNRYFAQAKYLDAWVAYTRALVFAPQDGKEAPLAYGNRSACYFNLTQFENALDDIESALNRGYDRFKPVTKLLIRKVECLLRLGRIAEARKLIDGPEKPVDSQSSDGAQWVKLAEQLKNASTKAIRPLEDANRFKDLEFTIKFNRGKFESNEKLFSLSAKVALRYDSVRGNISLHHCLTLTDDYFTLNRSPPCRY